MFMCGSMMQNTLLRVFMWALGLSGFFGNIFVFIWRAKVKTRNDVQAVQAIFVGNLAISDLFMGIYMLFLASVDAYYGDDFYKFSDHWRVSVPCRVASVLTIVSSETSLFLLTFITIDRFLCLKFPFSTNHFKKLSAVVVVTAVWFITVSMSVLASYFAQPGSQFYELSDVCIGLPLIIRPAGYRIIADTLSDSPADLPFVTPVISKSNNSWYFPIAVFFGLNCILTTIIIILYILIFFAVRKSRRRAQSTSNIKQEIALALRMSTVVMTNCMCWSPIIILGIMSQFEIIDIPLNVYIWLVVFVLPINASINPYLYTVSLMLK